MSIARMVAVLLPLVLLLSLGVVHAQEEPAVEPSTPSATEPSAASATGPSAASAKGHSAGDASEGGNLSVDQAGLADRYERLAQVMLRLAELSAPTDPRRAAVLRQAVGKGQELDIEVRFESVVKLLENDRLSPAVKNQESLTKDLEQLLELLLKEDRASRIEDEKRRIQRMLKEVGRIIKEQRGIKARTEGGDDLERVQNAQGRVTSRTGRLADELSRGEEEGKEGEGKEGEGKEGEGKEGEGKESEGKEGEGKQGEGKEGEGKQGEGKEGEGKEGEGKQGEGKEGEPKEGEGKEGEGKPKDPKEGEGKPGEPMEDEGKPSEGKPGEPMEGEGKPSEGKPGEPMEGEGKPSEGKPSEGKPSEGKPSEGKPSEGQPQEGQPQEGSSGEGKGGQQQDEQQQIKKRIQAAEERMRKAELELEKARRKGAADEQQKALEELEQARADLEKILRQLREEEIERMLAMLEARFRKMLEMQLEVYESTLRLDQVRGKLADRDDEIEAGRLSRREAEIVRQADRALTLLREEGSSLAFPEAVGQMRDDMEQVTVRLAQAKTGAITQGVEEDIIVALEEMIEAVKKALEDMEEKKQEGEQKPQQGEPQDQPLVDNLAELKMIRALQMRVNNRTERYSEMIEGEQADRPDLLQALDRLSGRQSRIHEVTRDLHLGKNK